MKKRQIEFINSSSSSNSPSPKTNRPKRPRNILDSFEMAEPRFVAQAEKIIEDAEDDNSLKSFMATLLQTNENLRNANASMKAQISELTNKVDFLTNKVSELEKKYAQN